MEKNGFTNDLQRACVGELHPLALRGFKLFDERQYWHAHEALEAAWLEEPGPVRDLYRGILQAGVVYLHVQRENYAGAVKVYKRCRRWLDPFPKHCRGLDIGQLRADLEAVYLTVRVLGPDSLDRFDEGLLRPITWVSQPPP
jgi:predicted metal-dependent hydrolase